jgi:hypothetical protein
MIAVVRTWSVLMSEVPTTKTSGARKMMSTTISSACRPMASNNRPRFTVRRAAGRPLPGPCNSGLVTATA